METTKMEELLAWLEGAQESAARLIANAPKGDVHAQGYRNGIYLAYGHVIDKVKSLV